MKRRHFLSALAASAGAFGARAATAAINRITLAPIEGRFHKFVAMNRYDNAPKGHTYANMLVRIGTDQGVEGVGVLQGVKGRPETAADLRKLLGADPLALYEMREGRIVGRSPACTELLSRHRDLDGPLFDLVGKLTSLPAWKLIGDSVRDRVEVYDGTLYFSDVWFSDRGVRAVAEEAEEAQKKGYRGIKLKIGRGWKWMEAGAGFRRDVEVTRAVRKAVGPEMKIMVDANNGYQRDPERAWQLLEETAGDGLYFFEEPFVENVERYSRLREQMLRAGLRVLIADGEGTREAAAFEPYLKPKLLVDVLQMDMREGGFLDNLAVARMAEPAGALVVPHNWGSQTGGLMGLQFAKAVRNAPAAEDDRSTCDAILTDGYEFRGGTYTVPDKPGMSIRVDEAVYRKKYQKAEVVLS